MTEQKQIKITIDPMGTPKVEAINFHGEGCVAATANIEAALGDGKVVARDFKPEINDVEEQNVETNKIQW